MNMVIGSKVKELRHGAGWATHVNTEVSRKDGSLAQLPEGDCLLRDFSDCACSIL